MDFKVSLYNQPIDLPCTIKVSLEDYVVPNDNDIRSAVVGMVNAFPDPNWTIARIQRIPETDVSLS